VAQSGASAGGARLAAPLPQVAPPTDEAMREGTLRDAGGSELEFAPMAGRIIDDRHLMLYRTVVRDTRGYRQGVLLDVGRLGDWLRQQGLGSDGLGEYARVAFSTPFAAPEPAGTDEGAFVYQHRFAEPFDDLTARLGLRPLPGVGSVTYVYVLAALVLAAVAFGLAALYRMVAVMVGFAERRSNFVAAVSHELKTPLTAIRMYGEMLRDGMVPTEAKRDEYYRHITVESERLSRLINNVLEFSRLEKGTREVALVSGSVAPIVREVAGLLRPHVEGQGFDLCIEVEPDLPPVRYERDALMQVLWNLVDNAVKYARDATPKQIALRGWHDGDGVHVVVRDHGPGVPARHLARIFEPFYRGESELTRRNKGTGLGLALVRGLVERMGARVSGRNVPDGGFEVEIAFRPLPA
jgi:signal transduction histidine kinase